MDNAVYAPAISQPSWSIVAPAPGRRPIGVKMQRNLTLRSGPEGRVSIRAK